MKPGAGGHPAGVGPLAEGGWLGRSKAQPWGPKGRAMSTSHPPSLREVQALEWTWGYVEEGVGGAGWGLQSLQPSCAVASCLSTCLAEGAVLQPHTPGAHRVGENEL